MKYLTLKLHFCMCGIFTKQSDTLTLIHEKRAIHQHVITVSFIPLLSFNDNIHLFVVFFPLFLEQIPPGEPLNY